MLNNKAIRFDKYTIVEEFGEIFEMRGKTFIMIDKIYPETDDEVTRGVCIYVGFQVTSKISGNPKYQKLIFVETLKNEKLAIKTDQLYECIINLDKINKPQELKTINSIKITDDLLQEIGKAVDEFEIQEDRSNIFQHHEDTLKIIKPKREMVYDVEKSNSMKR